MDQKEIGAGKILKPAPKLNRENTRIDLHKRSNEINNFVLGLSPYPGAHTQLSNFNGISFSLKIFSVTPTIEKHEHLYL